MFETKKILKDHRIENKWTEYNIFELNYGNRKLSNDCKFNQVTLFIAVLRLFVCN